MKLWIVRHADAAPAPRGGSDFDRPLSPAGLAECERLSPWLRANAALADRMISSDARRAHMTATLLAPAFRIPIGRLLADHRLYQASPAALLDVIRETPADVSNLVVVAHNPGVSELVAALVDGRFRRPLPTLGIVAVQVGTDWASVAAGVAEFDAYIDPGLV